MFINGDIRHDGLLRHFRLCELSYNHMHLHVNVLLRCPYVVL